MADRIRIEISGDASSLQRASAEASRSLSGLSRAAATQNRLTAASTRSTAQATAGLRGWASQAQIAISRSGAMDAAWRKQQQSASSLFSTVKTGTTILAGLGAVGVGAVVKSGLEFNATMESNQMAFERFLGSAKEADAFLKDMFTTAKKTPFEFTDLTTASRRLLAFGMSATQTKDTLNAVGDAIAAMGGGAENIDRVTLALGQMQAKGKVSAEELLQLSEAGIPAYKILAEQLDMTGEQIANIGNEGVTAKEGITALVRGMRQEFGGASADFAKTFSGQISTLKDNFAQTTGAMTENLFEQLEDWTPAVNKTMMELTKIFKDQDLTLEQQLTASRATISENLGPIVDEIEQAIDDADLGQKLADGFEAAMPVVIQTLTAGAGELAVAFAKAWWDAGVWAKLFSGAYIVSKLGGFSFAGRIAADQFSKALTARLGSEAVTDALIGGGSGAAASGGMAAWATRFAGGLKAALGNAMKGGAGLPAASIFLADLLGPDKLEEQVNEAMDSVAGRIKLNQSEIAHWQHNIDISFDKSSSSVQAWRAAIAKASDDIEKDLATMLKPLGAQAGAGLGAGLVRSFVKDFALAEDFSKKGVAGILKHIDELPVAMRDDAKKGAIDMINQLKRAGVISAADAKRAVAQIKHSFADLAADTKRETKTAGDAGILMARAFDKTGTDSKRALDKLKKDAGGTLGDVGDIFENLRDTAIGALDDINSQVEEALGNLGLKAGIAFGTSKGDTGKKGGKSGKKHATGGIIPGHGLKDTVPLGGGNVGAPGEAWIANRHTMRRVNERLAASAIPGPTLEGEILSEGRPHSAPFAKGGLAKGIGSGVQAGGLVGLGKSLQSQGYEVSEHPAFGGVTGGAHATNSLHYSGNALDVNDDVAPFGFGSGEKASLDHLAGILQKAGWHYLWQVPDHYDHLHVDTGSGVGGSLGGIGAMAAAAFQKIIAPMITGPDGPLKDIAQGSVDKVAKAANDYLSQQAPKGGFGKSGDMPSGGNFTKGQLVQLAKSVGMENPNLMAAIALAESGGSVTATNSNSNGSTDYGLWQVNSVHGFPTAQLMTPQGNAKAAAQILHSQGLGAWVAYNNGNYQQFLTRGGKMKGPGADRVMAKFGADPSAGGGGGGGGSSSGSTKLPKPTGKEQRTYKNGLKDERDKTLPDRKKAFDNTAKDIDPKNEEVVKFNTNYNAAIRNLSNRIKNGLPDPNKKNEVNKKARLEKKYTDYLAAMTAAEQQVGQHAQNIDDREGYSHDANQLIKQLARDRGEIVDDIAGSPEAAMFPAIETRLLQIANRRIKIAAPQNHAQERELKDLDDEEEEWLRGTPPGGGPSLEELKEMADARRDYNRHLATDTAIYNALPAGLQSAIPFGHLGDVLESIRAANVPDRPNISAKLDALEALEDERDRIEDLMGATTDQADTAAETRAALLAQIAGEEARGRRLDTRGSTILGRFAAEHSGEFSRGGVMPFLGSFDRGTDRIIKDGIAKVHKGEQIVPSQDGPFGSKTRGAAPVVNVYVDGDASAIVKAVRVEVDGVEQRVSQNLGRRARLLTR